MNAPNTHASFEPDLSRFRSRELSRADAIPASFVAATEFVILLFPGFSQLSLSSLIEPLRIANSVSARNLFRWRLLSINGKPVTCASGVTVGVAGGFSEERRRVEYSKAPATVVLCAGEGVDQHGSSDLGALLRLCVRRNVSIYTLGTATWLLAEFGLLGNARCTIHWDRIPALSEMFYGLKIYDALFVRDGHFVTCAGEFAAFDLAIDILRARCGTDLANTVCRYVTADRWREGNSLQSAPPGLSVARNQKLVRIIRLMQQNVEEPASLHEISKEVGLSRRQIERLFHRHLSVTPRQYYLTLRLARARQLIESTNLPILSVAVACGFASSSNFSKCFRGHYGMLPRALRR